MEQKTLYLQVTLMGIGAFLGGMITLTPECRQPRIAPPRASTMKETRNLKKMFVNIDELGFLSRQCPGLVRAAVRQQIS